MIIRQIIGSNNYDGSLHISEGDLLVSECIQRMFHRELEQLSRRHGAVEQRNPVQRIWKHNGIGVQPDRAGDIGGIGGEKVAAKNNLQGTHITKVGFDDRTIVVPKFSETRSKPIKL